MNRLVDELSSMMSREVLAVVDVVKLVTDPAFFGIGVPRGNGQRVVVIPGLFGNDLYLQPLNNWLYRIGYSPICSEVAPNAGCLQRLRDEILRRIDRRLGVIRARSRSLDIAGEEFWLGRSPAICSKEFRTLCYSAPRLRHL